MITYVFRKRSSTGFSIEKLFDDIIAQCAARGLPVARLELPHRTTGLRSIFKNIWHTNRTAQPGILHVTGDIHYAALLNSNNKVIITVHDIGMVLGKNSLLRFVFWLIWFRLPIPRATAITVISEKTRKELQSLLAIPPEKIHLIPNFVSPKYQPVAREFNSSNPRILHIGTNENKNLPRVIDALQSLPVTLVIVGPLTAKQAQLLQSTRLRYEHHVSIDDDHLYQLYQNADIISFPSTFEGFGMPILEGQAVGRPVLTSNIEPMIGVAGPDGALLVDPFSVSAIRTGFISLIENAELRNRLVANGLRNCQQYSLESIADRYQALYQQLGY